MSAYTDHTPPLYFVDPSMLLGNQIVITDEAYRHAVAQRLTPGEIFRAVIGDTRYDARVQEISPGKIFALIVDRKRVSPPPFRVHLYAALLKHQSLDLVVEKTTEIGITSFTPIVTSRTIPRLDGEKAALKRQRWQRVAKAASEQSGRGFVPEIRDVLTFSQVMDAGVSGVPLLAHEHEGITAGVEEAIGGRREVSVVIGPEGGLDASEVEDALHRGYIPVSLGPYIMKAETAAIAAAAVLVSRLAGR